MTKPLEGRVALVTGAGRGQGRSHAVELARRGADVALCDLCGDIPAAGYPLATRDDLDETRRLVEAEGVRCVAQVADVRDLDAMLSFNEAVDGTLGPVGILIANAGISSISSVLNATAEQWGDVIDTNLTGVFNAMRAVAPGMRRARWGRIVAISSMMGRSANAGIPAYTASKWGVIGLCKSVAQELAAFGVTVNVVAPGNVSTPMIHNEMMYTLMRPDLEHPTMEDVAPVMAEVHGQPVPWLEPEEVTAAVMFLVLESGRHVTGSVFDINAGASASFTA